MTAQIARRLIDARRWAEADALVDGARLVNGDNASIATASALSAQARDLHSDAAARWSEARRLGAKEPFASARHAQSLRLLGQLPAAQVIADAALARHPDDVRVLSEAARIAQDDGRHRDAAALWMRAIERGKPRIDWLQGYGLSLLRAGDLDDADAVLAAARRGHPQDLDLLALHGWIALRRQDWPQAIAIWTEHCRRVPDGTRNKEALGEAVHAARMSEPTGESAPSVQAEAATSDDDPMRRLVLGFESLGDSCEMGLVQRRYGAEPLGLLRWNDVDMEDLIAALDQSFAGMGEPANTEMIVAADGELFLQDRRWTLYMQTFTSANRVDKDDFYKKMCRRIVYLRGKLLDDLKAAEKIFVYRSSEIDAAGLKRLHRALRAHGPVTLLSVQPGMPVGAVEDIEEGLYIGFLPHLGSAIPSNFNIDFATWTNIFAEVHTRERARFGRKTQPSS